jgi:hypothetical protein
MGEMLYIPSFWFHYIVSQDASIQCNARSGDSDIGRKDITKCGFYSAANTDTKKSRRWYSDKFSNHGKISGKSSGSDGDDRIGSGADNSEEAKSEDTGVRAENTKSKLKRSKMVPVLAKHKQKQKSIDDDDTEIAEEPPIIEEESSTDRKSSGMKLKQKDRPKMKRSKNRDSLSSQIEDSEVGRVKKVKQNLRKRVRDSPAKSKSRASD